MSTPWRRRLAAALLGLVVAWPAAAAAPAADGAPRPCRLRGVEHEVRCGHVLRPLDPQAPAGRRIEVHYAVLPALARNKRPDPVFFFAGGPGQSAIDLAGPVAAMLARFGNRRDVVLVDQRGTGRSAPLACDDDDPAMPLAELVDAVRQVERLRACRAALQKLPHGDLRQYTTTIAMADVDAVRAALGVERINVVGGSYGTRAALEYMRQFPARVRRAVLDGAAPPDMVLPDSFGVDNQAALDALWAACEAETACRQRHPQLRGRWQALLSSLPREVRIAHPASGRSERLTLTRDALAGFVRAPLYAPALAAALPAALAAAAEDRFEALVALSATLGGGSRATRLAGGMHFSVVCAEDAPRMAASAPAGDFGDAFARVYRQACADWPRGNVPAAFYAMPPAPAPTLVLSGGIDPVTPPRHGERVVAALGARARHVIVPQAGHGLLALGCTRDIVYRFVDAEDAAQALAVDTACITRLPRPPMFEPPAPGRAAGDSR